MARLIMKKVVIVTNIPNPYRVPLFNELNEQLKQHDLSLTVVFGAEGYARRKFVLEKSDLRFDYVFLQSSSYQMGDAERTVFTYAGLEKVLNDLKPAVVVTPGFSPATMKVVVWKMFRSVKHIIWSGSLSAESAGGSLIRKVQRNVLVRMADAVIAYGSLAKKYLISLGAKEHSAFVALNTVDTSFFEQETAKARTKVVSDGLKHLTYVGYLSPRKNVSLVIEAVKKLAAKRSDFVLDIVGDGEEKTLLESKVRELNLQSFVIFHGFRQKDELPAFFARSSMFLFQTDFDIWGLVLNEAMAAGIPCLVSPNAGAAFDLVKEGETGYVCNYIDVDSVVAKIEYLLDHPEEVSRIGQNSSKFIRERAGLSHSALGFVNGILYTLKKK